MNTFGVRTNNNQKKRLNLSNFFTATKSALTVNNILLEKTFGLTSIIMSFDFILHVYFVLVFNNCSRFLMFNITN